MSIAKEEASLELGLAGVAEDLGRLRETVASLTILSEALLSRVKEVDTPNRKEEYYFKRYQELTREVLRFKKRIEDLNLESGYRG